MKLLHWLRRRVLGHGDTGRIEFQSTLKCPSCGFTKTEKMPEQETILIYHCTACDLPMLAQSELCVFCTYGTYPCPARQRQQACRSTAGNK